MLPRPATSFDRESVVHWFRDAEKLGGFSGQGSCRFVLLQSSNL